MSQEIDNRIIELNRQLASLSEEIDILKEKSREVNENSEEYSLEQSMYFLDEMHTMLMRYDEIHKELRFCKEQKAKMYHRPTGGFFGFISKLLPALPDHRYAVQPNRELLGKLPAMPKQAIWTIIACVTAAAIAGLTIPWMAISPAMHAVTALAGFMSETVAYIFVAASLIALAFINARHTKMHTPWKVDGSTYFDRDAISKEYWFRFGAEQWSLPVQIWSALLFGISYVFALVFLPLYVIVGFATFGFILTRTYIAAYNRTGSTDDAILAATKLHATIQRIGVFVLAPLVLVGLVITMLIT